MFREIYEIWMKYEMKYDMKYAAPSDLPPPPLCPYAEWATFCTSHHWKEEKKNDDKGGQVRGGVEGVTFNWFRALFFLVTKGLNFNKNWLMFREITKISSKNFAKSRKFRPNFDFVFRENFAKLEENFAKHEIKISRNFREITKTKIFVTTLLDDDRDSAVFL